MSASAGQARSTDHVARARAKILAQFRKAPFLRALVEIRARKWQAIEDAAWEVLDAQTIETAIGVGLDAIGVLVGRGRDGATDALYRLALRAQIRINRAQGNRRDTLEVGALTTPGITYSIHTYQPASYVVTPNAYLDPGVVGPLVINLSQVRPLGVQGSLSVYVLSVAGSTERALYGAQGLYDPGPGRRYGWSGDDQLGGRYSHRRAL